MNDKHMFEAAREASKNADYSGCSKVKLGCVAAYKGTILAKGCNSDKTHTTQAKYNKLRFSGDEGKYLPDKCHAEIACISKLKYLDIDFSKIHIYVYREWKNGCKAMARPCPACIQAIRNLGIQHLHYTTNDGMAHEKLDGDDN